MATITQDQVLSTMDELPAFPDAVIQILGALQDPDASLSVLSTCVERDPVLAGRVLSLANRAGYSVRVGGPVNDVFTAISLVGLALVRETVLLTRVGGFLQELDVQEGSDAFWRHCLAVTVCGVELAHYTEQDVGVDVALIACLLHDVGQLWLQRYAPERFRQVLAEVQDAGLELDVVERKYFGVDHSTVGAWLVQAWGLSASVVQAVAHHHRPDQAGLVPLTALVHVSEVLSQALELSDASHGRVTWISSHSCKLLGVDWGADTHSLFGRIEARSRHATALFYGLVPA